MIKETRVETIALTVELAREFATMPEMLGERDLKDGRQNWIRGLIKTGCFVGPRWCKGRERSSGLITRVDGQHSSTVLAKIADEAADSFPHDLNVTITTYDYDPGDEAQLFEIFNPPQSARDAIDKMGVYRAKHEDVACVEKALLVKVAKGIAIYNGKLDANERKIDQLPARQHGLYFNNAGYRGFALWIANNMLGGRNAWMLGRSGVVAQMCDCYFKSERVATAFWTMVLRDSDPDENGEARELAHTLNTWKGKPSKSQEDFRKQAEKAFVRYYKLAAAQQMPKLRDDMSQAAAA